MKYRVNSYVGMLFVAIVAAGAAMLIIHVAYANNFAATLGGSEAAYAPLQQSILHN